MESGRVLPFEWLKKANSDILGLESMSQSKSN
jgi:hypothetical protein